MFTNNIGALIGFCIGLVIAIVLIIVSNKNKKFKTEYDERQKLIRGDSYKYGYTFLVIYLLLLTIINSTGLALVIDASGLAMTGILISVTIVTVYSIWNGAYWGLNNNVKRYMVIFIAGFIINGLAAIMAIIHGTMVVDGMVTGSYLNLLVTIMFIILSVVMYIRHKVDSPNGEED